MSTLTPTPTKTPWCHREKIIPDDQIFLLFGAIGRTERAESGCAGGQEHRFGFHECPGDHRQRPGAGVDTLALGPLLRAAEQTAAPSPPRTDQVVLPCAVPVRRSGPARTRPPAPEAALPRRPSSAQPDAGPEWRLCSARDRPDIRPCAGSAVDHQMIHPQSRSYTSSPLG